MKKILTISKNIFLTLAIMLTLSASAWAQGGTTGPLSWQINDNILTISGNGDMPDYDYPKPQPWVDYAETITEVKIEDGVSSIGNYAFTGCTALKTATIPNSVTRIGSEAFRLSSITSIVIPNSVETIGGSAFSGCGQLATVILSNQMITIEPLCFYQCKSLTSISIPLGVKGIGYRAFGNSGLTAISFPGSVLSIGFQAFEWCESLETVTIPNNVGTIEDFAFSCCTKLISINVDNNNSYFSSEDGVLFNKDKTTLICCPGGKTGNYDIPSSVKKLGYYSFIRCESLTSLTIPSSVTEIDKAFFALYSLTSITNLNPVPVELDELEFEDTEINQIMLKVPINAVDAYKEAEIWNDFKIVGINVGVSSNEISAISVYPNPTTGPLTMDNGQWTINHVEIFDVYGKKQFSIVNSQLSIEKIDISSLPAGVYFIKIATEQGTITKKVVKQ